MIRHQNKRCACSWCHGYLFEHRTYRCNEVFCDRQCADEWVKANAVGFIEAVEGLTGETASTWVWGRNPRGRAQWHE